MLKRSLLAVVLLAAMTIAAQAHSLRVIATRPVVEPGRKTTVYLCWGHLLPIDELVNADDLSQYQIHAPSGSTTTLKAEGRSFQAHELVFDEPGLYQIVASRKPGIFTSYNDAEGKHRFVRAPKNEVKIPEGATQVQSAKSVQFAKAVVLCGAPSASQTMTPLGHPLEIIVESKPLAKGYSLDQPLQVRVLFQGKPLAGAKLFAANASRNPMGSPEVSADTDSEGRASIEVSEPGTWTLDVSHKIDPVEADRQLYDSQSFLATLSLPFGEED